MHLRGLFSPTQDTGVTFSLLTALAEGADRLVPREARGVLGEGHTEIEAVLPLTVEDYLTDFQTADSRDEFWRLWGEARSRVVLADGPKEASEERTKAYASAGRYIADRCDVMIAVWDGKQGRGEGGTADIVEYARDQGVPVLIVPASRGGCEPEENRLVSSFDGPAAELEGVVASFRRIDEYNRASVPERLVLRVEESARQSLEALSEASLIRTQVEKVTDWALPHLVRADALALRFQARYAYLAFAVHSLALLAVIAVGAQIVFARRTPEWLLIEVGLLLVLLGAVWAGRHGRTHDRWIGCRSLAEAFRSGFFIVLAAAAEGQEDGDTEPLPRDQPWSQRAFSEAWRQRPHVAYDEAAAVELRDYLVAGWIESQIRYHRGAARRYEQTRTWYATCISALAVTTIAVALIHILVVANSSGVANALEFVAIVLPGLGAAIAGLREQGQHHVHQDRSRRTIARLERLKSQSEQTVTLDSVRRLALETHRVIVEENQDWWGVIEFQDIELVL